MDTTNSTPDPSGSPGRPSRRDQFRTGLRHLRVAVAVESVAVMLLAVGAACSDPEPAGSDHICPDDLLVIVDVLEVSADSRDDDLLADRVEAMAVHVERAVDCEGRYTAVAYSSSPAGHRVLYDDNVGTQGATEIARDRKVPEARDRVMDAVRGELEGALGEVSPEGNDLSAAFVIAGDYYHSHEDAAFEVSVYSGGVSTVGTAVVNRPALTADEARTIAARAPLVDLSGAEVSIFGLGGVAGKAQPPADFVAALNAYATEMCDLTGAVCRVTGANR